MHAVCARDTFCNVDHVTCFASGRLQIIQANKECQEAKKTIEVLQARIEATAGPDNQAVETAVAKAKAEAEVEMETLQMDIASKERRIASLQASLVSLRKIVQKFEGAGKDSGDLAQANSAKTKLEQKVLELTTQLRRMDVKYGLAVRTAEAVTALAQRAGKVQSLSTGSDGAAANSGLEKKLRETQQLLLEAYAENDELKSLVCTLGHSNRVWHATDPLWCSCAVYSCLPCTHACAQTCAHTFSSSYSDGRSSVQKRACARGETARSGGIRLQGMSALFPTHTRRTLASIMRALWNACSNRSSRRRTRRSRDSGAGCGSYDGDRARPLACALTLTRESEMRGWKRLG